MTKPLSFQAVRQLEQRTPRPTTRQPGDVTRERLIQSGAIVPAEIAVDGRALHSRSVELGWTVLRLDDLGRRAAQKHIALGRGKIGRMPDQSWE